MSPTASSQRRPTAAGRAAGARCSASSATCSSASRPDEAAVEETFVNKNPASTLKLGVARGVVLLAPAERGLPVAEYSANLIKKSVVGAGHADKEQVQMMVRRLLPGCDDRRAGRRRRARRGDLPRASCRHRRRLAGACRAGAVPPGRRA